MPDFASKINECFDNLTRSQKVEGLIVVKNGQDGILENINIRKAAHPIPDKEGLDAAKEIKMIAEKACDNDIVFCAITGGSSALMPLPASDITLEEKRQINKVLLASGATIREINAVRKHLSAIKGGRLALYISCRDH